MKRFLSALLALLLCAGLCVPAFAARAEDTTTGDAGTTKPDCPIIFVTGIGQTWTHLVNEDGSYKYNDRKKPLQFNYFYKPEKKYKLIEYNLFYPDSNALKDPKVLFAALRAVTQFVASAVLDRDLVSQSDLETVVSAVFSRNIMDADGNLPSDVEDCLKMYPISEYNKLDKDNFYYSIPCESIAAEIGEENIYCFNHSAFDYLYDDADALNTMIRDYVLGSNYNKLGAKQVVLIPMSMGAGVVNAYLDRYGKQNDVKRVVSIVGAWDGTDLLADLIEGKYADNAPDLLYRDLMPEIMGGTLGYLITGLLRVYPKRVLRSIIDDFIGAFAQSMVLKAPSLVSMVPADRYDAIEREYLRGEQWEKIRTETHRFHDAQKRLTARLTELRQQGTEFYFICGYGMQFGDADFPVFHFMQSAASTNSDEIIQIDSTAPGTTYAPAGQSLGRTGRYVSPDGSIDLSTSFAPDRTWCFYQQKHQLEDNLTALRLALDISVGKVRSVEDGVYPQFGAARDVDCVYGWQEKLNAFIEANEADPAKAEDVSLAKKALALCDELLTKTDATTESDEAAKQEIREIVDKLDPPEKQKLTDKIGDRVSDFFTEQAKKLNDRLYDVFGAQGFIDKIFG